MNNSYIQLYRCVYGNGRERQGMGIAHSGIPWEFTVTETDRAYYTKTK